MREELVELGIHDPAKVGHARTIQNAVYLLNNQQNGNRADSHCPCLALGRKIPPTLAPLLVCVDAFGGGLVVPVPWQDAYQQAVEAHGTQLERIEFPDDDHFSLPQAAAPQAQAWLAQRFAP